MLSNIRVAFFCFFSNVESSKLINYCTLKGNAKNLEDLLLAFFFFIKTHLFKGIFLN
jgi:hypothetical protein